MIQPNVSKTFTVVVSAAKGKKATYTINSTSFEDLPGLSNHENLYRGAGQLCMPGSE